VGTDMPAEIDKYRRALGGPDFDGVAYLKTQYGSVCPGDMSVNNPHRRITASIGFWLRRGIDGSAPELWNGCAGVMKKFDRKWFNDLAGGNIGWRVEQQEEPAEPSVE